MQEPARPHASGEKGKKKLQDHRLLGPLDWAFWGGHCWAEEQKEENRASVSKNRVKKGKAERQKGSTLVGTRKSSRNRDGVGGRCYN